MTTTQLSYTVRFLCPAFLGNAEQSGQWRTPPFKALLRQWWRMAYAASQGFPEQVNGMHGAEGQLFGAAAEKSGSNRSRVRIRLDRWNSGSLKNWQAMERVWHPEVGQAGLNVGSDLYLGYGPLIFENHRTALKKEKAAIQANESAKLHIALTHDVSEQDSERIAKALALINLYGSLGGRSRNGWGSFVLEPLDSTAPPPLLDPGMLRPWRDALKLDWPHAIGEDGKGALIWQTDPCTDWKAAMTRLAEIKIRLRTQQFRFPAAGIPPYPRHWLSYPVTHHSVEDWDKHRPPLRLPNSLRFKLRPDSRDPAKLRGIIFHVPCLPPPEFKPNRGTIESVWEQVHSFLDKPGQRLSRIAA